MPKQTAAKHQSPLIILWAIGGAITLPLLIFLGKVSGNLPVQSGELVIPALLGGLGGFLIGRSDLRWRVINNRLADSNQRFRSLYQNTPAMLQTMDAYGTLLTVSQSWLDCLGYDRETVIGQNFFDFVLDDDVQELKQRHLQSLRDHGCIKNAHYTLQQADGKGIDVSITDVALLDNAGQLIESMAVISDLADYRAAEERVERLAYFDSLTGLPNRTLLNDRMLQAMAQSRRDNCHIGVFFFDLDRFKMINDTQGHATGDLVLRSVAQRLKKFIRQGDTFARLGGDEFVIIQADPNHDPSFTTMARRIQETLNEPFRLGDREFYTTASIGVAVYPIDGEDPQTLLKSADTAMYVAKSRGRNNYQFFSGEMNAEAIAKSNLENNLRKALQNNTLGQHYQAQVDLKSGKIIGIEALLRWTNDQGETIPTEEIISVAEESGLIYPLGEWTLKTACQQAKAWLDDGLDPGRISVNLSGHNIRQANFIDQIEEVLEETGLYPVNLEIELAETSMMDDIHDIIMALTDLKVRGIHLSIDDFGSGYSSLLYLTHFPIHRIKIAKEFIAGIGTRNDYRAITEAIIAMARRLGLIVSAVGVESNKQSQFLQEQGCDQAQGNYFSAALPPAEMTKLLKSAHDFPGNIFTDNIEEKTPAQELRELN